MIRRELPPSVLRRRAVVYVRQSTALQMQENLESQRLHQKTQGDEP